MSTLSVSPQARSSPRGQSQASPTDTTEAQPCSRELHWCTLHGTTDCTCRGEDTGQGSVAPGADSGTDKADLGRAEGRGGGREMSTGQERGRNQRVRGQSRTVRTYVRRVIRHSRDE